jgi:hypothetical protein
MEECVGTTVQQIQCALAPLADKLGQGAKYVWAANYRQTFIEGTLEILGALICTILAVVGGRLAFRKLRDLQRSREKTDEYGFDTVDTVRATVGFSALAVTLLSVGVGLSLLFAGLPKLLNPAYYTIARILEQVRG